MREEYIKLIKEYIKLKPEYRHTLDEIKANVLSVGATETEFEQAIKEITGLPTPSIVLIQTIKPQIQAIKKEKYYKEIHDKASGFLKNLNGRFKRNKRWFAASFLSAVVATSFSFVNFKLPPQTSNNIVQVSRKIIENKTKFPIVYANSMPIDAEKTFSFKPVNDIRLTVTNKPRREVLGFFPYWMLPIEEKISLDTLTTISLFAIEIDGTGNIVTQNSEGKLDGGWTMWQSPELNTLIKRAKNQNIKIYLTLKSFSNENIVNLALNDESQKSFISNALYLVNSKNLDGVNIDFEYTGEVNLEIKKGFTRLITNLNSELKRQIPESVLTIDTFLVSGSENGIFDIQALSRESDAFVIMGYDMHTPLGDPGPVSAMGGTTNIVGYVQGYLEKAPPEKIILAVPYYGYDWPADSNAEQRVKILPFAEILELSQDFKLAWDETSQTPHFNYTEDGIKRVVHFDNVRSLGIKYDFINKKDLRGVGIWALGYDGLNSDLQKLILDKFSD
ncbi:MAG: hypothetical protein HYT08_04330 [Candidatus Levybacteria bacterium]|nr:hypothetical protein [Candidatus Levybacteria bacterium]